MSVLFSVVRMQNNLHVEYVKILFFYKLHVVRLAAFDGLRCLATKKTWFFHEF